MKSGQSPFSSHAMSPVALSLPTLAPSTPDGSDVTQRQNSSVSCSEVGYKRVCKLFVGTVELTKVSAPWDATDALGLGRPFLSHQVFS